MKITLTFSDDDRRNLGKGAQVETTRRGLATRAELESEIGTLINAHWQDLPCEADEKECGVR